MCRIPRELGEIACPTGSITFTDNGSAFGAGTYILNSLGHTDTENQLVALTGGTHSLKATYSGDASYNAGSTTVVVTVTKAATNANAPTLQSTYFTQPVTISTLIQDPNALIGIDAYPTGQVTFYSNGTAIPGTVTYTNGNGIYFGLNATLTRTFSAAGTYSITASYSGDQNYQASMSPASSLVLTYPAPAASLTPGNQTVLPGANATLTAVIDTTNKTTYPTGTVSFVTVSNGATVFGPAACTNATDSRGNFACQVSGSFAPQATETVQAQYSGDQNYPATSSGAVTITVPDFAISSQGVNVTSAGQTGTGTVNVRDLSGFSGTVTNFACTGLPAETTCSFSPAQVSGNGSTTVTITTTAIGQKRRRASLHGDGIWRVGTEAALFLGMCLVGIPSSRRRRGAALALVMFAAFTVLPSCGGGGGGGGRNTTNPSPAITSLSPSMVAAGSTTQALSIAGSGFISSSTVTFNGQAIQSTLIDSNSLSVSLTPTNISTMGTYPVVVTNPSPGGGTASSNFNVVSGTPTGSFSATVTATSGSLTHSTTLNVFVE
jgi:Bacterial Ig-like domain (group 3)